MPTQRDQAETFASLHRPGDPLILYNAWDPGSAAVIAKAGAKAIATGSWSVAAAFGFADGEQLPLDLAIDNLERIVAAVDLPVTLDLEGGYGEAAEAVGAAAARAIAAGAVGCNFEDRIVGGSGLHPAERQAARIAAIRAEADKAGIPFFINARTDHFLQAKPEQHGDFVGAALDRAGAYTDAGASGFFVPGLVDEALIGRVCASSPLPVNIMAFPGVPSAERLAALGVSRISHGPGPYRLAMAALADAASKIYAGDI
jgi:2-methylisocitrate lyase-like PEP mutase family enzyme